MKLPKRIVSLLCAICASWLALAGMAQAMDINEITVSSEEWEGATQADGSGLYWDILRLVYEPAGIKLNWSVASYARSVALVKQNRADAWVGSYKDEEEGIVYPKWHFDADDVSALFLSQAGKDWQGEASLEGKNVAWIKGYELHEYISVSFNNRELVNRDSVIQLLESGRLDYFIDARPEIQTYFGETLQKDARFAVQTIKKLNLYLGFSNTQKGKYLAELFDERFPQLIASGELKTLFEKWGFEFIF